MAGVPVGHTGGALWIPVATGTQPWAIELAENGLSRRFFLLTGADVHGYNVYGAV